MFRGKIDRGLFSVSFIRESIQRHSAALRPYFPDFLALADGFARQCAPPPVLIGHAASLTPY